MTEPIQVIDYRGCKIEIYQDCSYDENPNDWDNAIQLVHFHRDFTIENDSLITEQDAADWYNGQKISQSKSWWIFPVAAYIHSGVSLSLSRTFAMDTGGWDTSHVGLIYERD